MKKIIFLFLALFTIIGTSQAQDELKFSGQIRPRFEVDNKDFNSSTLPNTFTAFRTRLGVSFVPVKDMTGFFQVQDSRIFGEETSTSTNMKNLDLHQAYFQIQNIFDLPIDIKVGRMEIAFGSERFMSGVGWNNVGRSFDGGLFTLKTGNVKIDLFTLKEFEKSNAGDSLDQSVYGVNFDIGGIENYKLQPFVIWQRSSPVDLLSRFTFGTYVKGEHGNFSHEIDAAYQAGKIYSSNRKQTIGAYVLSYNGNYIFDSPIKPSLGFQIDYTSGDDNGTDDDYNVYSSVYGSGHKFFGNMDYFVNLVNDTYGLGIMDIIGKVGINPLEALKLNLNFHIFQSDKDYTLVNGSTSKSFGSELDFVANYKYNKIVSFECGASLFMPGDIFKETRGEDTATWFYLMAIANF
jgi:hypothetical protein